MSNLHTAAGAGLVRVDDLRAGDRIRRHGLTWTVHEVMPVHDPDGISGVIATAEGSRKRQVLVVTSMVAAVRLVLP